MTKLNQTLLLVAVLAGALASTGCKPKVPVEATDSTPKAAAPDAGAPKQAAPAPARPLPNIAPPERVAEIESSGRTGFWSSVTEFCPGSDRSTILAWNVKASGAKNVIVYVVDKKLNQERHFGRGGPVGERQTGPWLQPGLTFKLRNADGGAELGSITIDKGASC